MRKRKHWLYAMTFLGGCLLLTPGSGSVLAGEQFSYQLNDNTAEAKETPVSSSAAANTALSEMNLIFDVTFPMTAEGETEANPEMRIETSLDVFGEDGWWEGSVYLNDTLSYCYLVDASTGKVIKLSDQVTAQKLVDIDMYEKQFSRWDLMELTSEDSWLEELKKYKDGTLFSRDALLDKLTIGEMNSHYLQVAVTAYDPIADVGPDRGVFWMEYESRQPLEASRADLMSIVGQTG